MSKEYDRDVAENNKCDPRQPMKKEETCSRIVNVNFPTVFELLHVDLMSSTKCLFYLVPEEGRFIALEANIRQNVSFTAG
jgi:hypothetical protein